jgi:hypothetical protein
MSSVPTTCNMANTTMQAGNDARDAAGHNRRRTSRTQPTQAGKLDDLPGWTDAMIRELSAPRLIGKFVRVHDAGDFFSDAYTLAWCRVMRACPQVTFYCYTKEVRRFKRLIEPDPPENFLWVYSYGGREDSFIDPDRDRVADVFPDEAAIASLLDVRVDARREGSQSDELAGVLGAAGCGAEWGTAAVAGWLGGPAVPRGHSGSAGG